MPTGQEIINNALLALNILDAGGSVSASENVDLLAQLNTMLDSWAADSLLIPGIGTFTSGALTAAVKSYLLGPTGAAGFVTARPSRIVKATMIAVVGAGTNRQELKLVSADVYASHNDLAAAASSAEELFVDYTAPNSTIYPWPVPTCPTVTTLELLFWRGIATFTLAGNISLLPSYQDTIEGALAFRCLSRYGAIVSAETAQAVTAVGLAAKERLKKLNALNNFIDPAVVAADQPPQPQAGR